LSVVRFDRSPRRTSWLLWVLAAFLLVATVSSRAWADDLGTWFATEKGVATSLQELGQRLLELEKAVDRLTREIEAERAARPRNPSP